MNDVGNGTVFSRISEGKSFPLCAAMPPFFLLLPALPRALLYLLTGIYVTGREMPGFGPAAEVLLFRQKDPKPLTPRPSHLIDRTLNMEERANSLHSDKARQDMSVRPGGRAGGVGLGVGAVGNLML